MTKQLHSEPRALDGVRRESKGVRLQRSVMSSAKAGGRECGERGDSSWKERDGYRKCFQEKLTPELAFGDVRCSAAGKDSKEEAVGQPVGSGALSFE